MIIAGTAVGAGMFSLPIAMSGIWFGWSVAVFLLTWFCMLLSGMMILEANLNYPVARASRPSPATCSARAGMWSTG